MLVKDNRPLVALDGRFLQHETYARRGIGRLLRSLAERLPAVAHDLRFVLAGAEGVPFALGEGPAAALERATYPRSLLARRAPRVKLALLAEEAGLRAALARSGARALLVPSQHGMWPLGGAPRVLLFLDAIPYLPGSPEARSLEQRAFRAVTGQGARRARRVVAISRSAAADAVRHVGIRPSRLSVAPLGVDAGFRPPAAAAVGALRGRFGLPARYLLHVGGFDARKNVAGLLDAFARAAPAAPDVHLVLAGRVEAHQRAALEAGISGLGPPLAARVRALGFVPDEELPALLGGALALAFASRYEGFGLPVLEAMACGAPVVAFDNSSIPEVAGDAALLVRDGDGAAFAEALGRVATDPALAADLRARGPARAAGFTWEACARGVAEALRDAIG